MLYFPALPLPNPHWIPITGEKLVARTLASFEITKIGDLFTDCHIFSVTEDTHLQSATFMERFVMSQILSAMRTLIPTFQIEPVPFAPLTTITESVSGEHLITKLYKACAALVPCNDDKLRKHWEEDLGHPILDEQWEKCCMATQEVSLNSKHKLIHFKFLRRIYITPEKQNKIDPNRPHNCVNCRAPHADFIHLAWSCPKIYQY